MELDIKINENACFYYWVQAISGWNTYPPEKKSYEFYQAPLKCASIEQKQAVQHIRATLKKSKDPHSILAELYVDKIESKESVKIAKTSNCLRELFRPIVDEAILHLRLWKRELDEISATIPLQELERIGSFLGTTFNINTPCETFLIQNPAFASSMGHVIRGASFILVHPAGREVANGVSKTLSTLLHEYTHILEFHSKTTEQLFKSSYDKIIQPKKPEAPSGFTWRLLYSEVIAYCFANNITGGYFRPYTYSKSRPSVAEMRKGFLKLVDSESYTTNDIIAWIGLVILPEVENYLKQDKTIDSFLADKISYLFLEFFVDV